MCASINALRVVQHAMETVWEVLDFSANTIVFVYAGVLISARIYEGHQGIAGEASVLQAIDWAWAVLNWAVLVVIRFVTISIMKPLLNLRGEFSWSYVILATWGGLRGAVGLSLALLVDLESIQNGNLDSRCVPF